MKINEKRLDEIMAEVDTEVVAAVLQYPRFNTAHEGYAVLLEEVDELWDQVKVRQGRRDLFRLKREAIQVAAMAIRFVLDIAGDEERGQR